MIASQEITAFTQDLIKVCHIAFLLFFGVAVVLAGATVFKLRSSSGTINTKLFTFGYFSLSAWILWVIQYAILAAPMLTSSSGFSTATVLWLGFVQNLLWAFAVLSLRVKCFSQKSRTLPLLAIVSLCALVAYKAGVLSSPQIDNYVATSEGLLTGAMFFVLAILTLQLSKISAAGFLAHAYTQWFWRGLSLTSPDITPFIHFAFPVSRGILFFLWTRLLSQMALEIHSAHQKPVERANQPPVSGIQKQRRTNLRNKLTVMISSTVEDLVLEREAADRAIRILRLERFRAETLGSRARSPEEICAMMAEQCDIFVLIIGERYGYEIKSKNKSVVEFEYETAFEQNRGKILVYIKQGVTREPRLKEFVDRVEDFTNGYFRTLFKTHEELPEQIQADITRWLIENGLEGSQQ